MLSSFQMCTSSGPGEEERLEVGGSMVVAYVIRQLQGKKGGGGVVGQRDSLVGMKGRGPLNQTRGDRDKRF